MNVTIAQLDGPRTLRPHIAHFFRALIHSLGGPWHAAIAWRDACLFLLLLPLFVACVCLWRQKLVGFGLPSRITGIVSSRTTFFVALLAAMLVIRLPSLLLPEINVDESQFIASAQKLASDPIFFRSVDCGTVGPVDVYPLDLPFLLGITPDYASSRAIGLLMTFGSVWILYLALGRLTIDGIARIAIVPVATVLASIHTWDLEHYASEVPTLLLVSAAFYCTVRIIAATERSRAWFGWLGMVSCLGFLAKMQCLPLIASLTAVALIILCVRNSRLLWPGMVWYAGGLALPFVCNAIICGVTGVWPNFWNTYILANHAYASETQQFTLMRFSEFVLGASEVGISFFVLAILMAVRAVQLALARRAPRGFFISCVLFALVSFSVASGLKHFGTHAAPAVLAIAGIFLLVQGWSLFREPKQNPNAWLPLAAFALIAAAFISIYVPHRLFGHYLLLSLIPAGLGIASLLLTQSPATREGAAFLVLFIGISLSLMWYLLPKPVQFRDTFAFARQTIRSPEGNFVRSLSRPGGEMVVWGWDAKLYLEAGILPATRDTNMRNFFETTQTVESYYHRRFMKDIAASRPEIFVDAAVPDSLLMDQRYRMEALPDVAAYVEKNYSLVLTDPEGKRYFVRKDLLKTLGGSRAKMRSS